MLTRRTPQRGVTLIELAVTFIVLGLLVVAAGPSITAWIGNTNVRNTASSIYAGLNRARAEAVRVNRPVRFSLVAVTDPAVLDNSCALSATGVSWVVSVNDPTSLCSVAPSETVAPLIVDKAAGGDGGRRVTVAALQADGATAANSITFNAFGRVADATAIARIDIDNQVAGGDYRALRVLVGNGGTVRMCDVKVTDSNDPRKC
jgi:type IV fimbrial biogenesis protein FimT